MQLILLTHSREVVKPTNTGQLIEPCYKNTRTIIWERVSPDPILLEVVRQNTALVYPSENAIPINDSPVYDNYILIDSTWQEARKIYNHSPYLQQLPCIELQSSKQSKYNLRRNQRDGGLCTAECALHLFENAGLLDEAVCLEKRFMEFIKSR